MHILDSLIILNRTFLARQLFYPKHSESQYPRLRAHAQGTSSPAYLHCLPNSNQRILHRWCADQVRCRCRYLTQDQPQIVISRWVMISHRSITIREGEIKRLGLVLAQRRNIGSVAHTTLLSSGNKLPLHTKKLMRRNSWHWCWCNMPTQLTAATTKSAACGWCHIHRSVHTTLYPISRNHIVSHSVAQGGHNLISFETKMDVRYNPSPGVVRTK